MEFNQELVSGMKNELIVDLFGEADFTISLALAQSLFWGAIAILFWGLDSKVVETKTIPNQGIWLSTKNALLIGLGFGIILGIFVGTVFGMLYGLQHGVINGLAVGIGFPLWGFIWYGGADVIQHYTLRVILWYRGHTPFIYFRFLNYATERIFLQRVGGGYIFIHRLLLEHFAAMDETKAKPEGSIDTQAIEVT
jgi:hypothetical protein